MSKKVVVVGGGISGLTVAYEMKRRNPNADVTVLEKSGRPGGKVLTIRDMGFVAEAGPDAFLQANPAALELIADLGLTADVVQTRPENSRVYILVRGSLVPLPEGLRLVVPTDLGAVRASGLFSTAGFIRLGVEQWLPGRAPKGDETIGKLLRRRFGGQMVDRLAQPLLGGIYGGDVDSLGVEATFPDLARMEREHGSLIKAARASAIGVDGALPTRPFASLAGGMDTLVGALTRALGDSVVTGVRATQLGMRGPTGQLVVGTDDGQARDCDAIVLALPAPASITLAHGMAPHLARGLAALKHVSTAIVSLGFRASDVAHPLDGYGFLVAKGEDSQLRGCTWSSSKLPKRAPEGHVLVRAFLGGYGREADVALADEELAKVATDALTPLLGINGRTVFWDVRRWPEAQPQYEVGHAARIKELRAAAPAGLHLVGASYDGVGLPACIASARRLGEELAA